MINISKQVGDPGVDDDVDDVDGEASKKKQRKKRREKVHPEIRGKPYFPKQDATFLAGRWGVGGHSWDWMERQARASVKQSKK